jgi:two-component system sensor histidine kinase KdpD
VLVALLVCLIPTTIGALLSAIGIAGMDRMVRANVIVLANLLDNAAKYTPAGTQVRIHAQAQDSTVKVTVEDAGPGLPSGERERLFDKFQRGKPEGIIVGAGLGLAICRAIVRAHGGDITAGERPGGGARFEFTLPIREDSP